MGREVVLCMSDEKKSNLEIASSIRQVADKIEQEFMKLGQNDKGSFMIPLLYAP